MKQIVLALIIIFTLSATILAKYEEEDGVVILTDDDFDEFIQKNEMVLVKFYAPWCGHCKHLAPEYAAAAKHFKSSQMVVPLAQVDATKENKLAERFQIQGFPTLKFFIRGNPIDYTGGRTKDTIIQWVEKKAGPSVYEIVSQTELDQYTKSNQVVFLLASGEKVKLEFFQGLSQQIDDAIFCYTKTPELIKSLGLKEKSEIVVFKQFDEPRVEMAQEFEESKFEKFVNKHRFPKMMSFNERSAERIFTSQVSTMFLITNSKDKEQSQKARLNFEKFVSSNSYDNLYFAEAESEDGMGDKLIEFFGITPEQFPIFVLVEFSDNDLVKYYESALVGTERIGELVKNFFDKKLKPFYKSEEIPEKNDDIIIKVVGKNFDQIVKDQSKDVLIFFFAPWCHHCQKFHPYYDQLAKTMKESNPDIVFAKIDGTLNEIPGISIQGFPTVFFYPKNQKDKPITFDKDRTQEGLVEFLKEKASAWHDVTVQPLESEKAQASQQTEDDAQSDL